MQERHPGKLKKKGKNPGYAGQGKIYNPSIA